MGGDKGMTREIKFRGQAVGNGGWVYGYYVYTFEIGYNAQGLYDVPPRKHYIFGNSGDFCEVDPDTVGQYTEVHDDTDEQEELYDGDIAEVEHKGKKHVCKVQYCGSGYMFVADTLLDGYLWFSDIIEFDREYCWAEGTRKLGNIYENPDLLEVSP